MDRRTVLAFVLIGVILILMPYYLDTVAPPTKAPPREVAADTSWAVDRSMIEALSTLAEEEGVAAERYKPPMEVGEGKWRPIEPVAPVVFTVDTDLYVAEISSRAGGSIVSWQLKKYASPSGGAVQLIADPSVPNLAVSLVAFPNDSVDFADAVFVADIAGGSLVGLTDAEPEFAARFYLELPEGRSVEKVLTFRQGTYGLGVDVRLTGFSQELPHRRYALSWRTPLASTEVDIVDEMGYARAYALLGSDIEEVDAKESGVVEELAGVTNWTAVRTKYFVAAIMPQGTFGLGARLEGRTRRLTGGESLKEFAMTLRVPLAEDGDVGSRFIAYVGPLEYGLVKSYGVGLEGMMNFGWGFIRPISKVVLLSFTWMHRGIGNYGIVILLFSLLVKVIVYPLTHKSYVSMKKMQNLQPQISALREKYKGDAQTLNKKVMSLYKQSGANPLGGCLPILLQMPLLFALFVVFRSTIELRGAPFVWWIGDLSAQDVVFTLPFALPLYGANVCVLPLLMGATTFLQQKMSGAQATQQQAAMLYIMPVFMMLIFNRFPSGLNLYYTVFNILTILQQKYLVDRKGKAPEAEESPKKRKQRQ